MKAGILLTVFWLILFSGLALSQGGENMGPKCQKLAHEFSEDPNSLNEMELTQLQFCVTQTIEQRQKTNPPDLLRGTIIEPPMSSNGSDPKTQASPQPSDVQ
ncbi:MAG: hypothetical protein NPIRA06_13440 [Nitrospirales bacterium]|nr:MAG: hypothetical protein NPIRA06_13440 [Nitrospirales bacterium]